MARTVKKSLWSNTAHFDACRTCQFFNLLAGGRLYGELVSILVTQPGYTSVHGLRKIEYFAPHHDFRA